jgi:hypothetical protein
MPDSGIFVFIQDLLRALLGYEPPAWILAFLAGIILLGLVVLGIELIALAVKKIWIEIVQPAFYNPNDRQRRYQRKMFADHIDGEIRILNSKEVWNDNRFTDLEAHVEAEIEKRRFFRIRSTKQSGIRLQKSLSKAIEKSTFRLVLLEGDPGSGKSVALRHVAQVMARKAHKSRNLKTRIPLYVNLKYLQRTPATPINRSLIEDFVIKNINRIGDRDIDEFISNEFDRGLQEGTWLFLFDSFDEIPEILSSTGSDELIRQYAEAIRDFLHGMNQCKGILASREYKGPRFLGWPMFRILPLTSVRRLDLIRRTGLSNEIQRAISNGLALASADFRVMASNPMFLNLVCEYMNKRKIPEFPTHIYMVFEEYIQKRLIRDEERLLQKFGKTPNEVKAAAEKIAFCMTSDQGLGLVPTIEQLRQSTLNLGLGLGNDFDTYINCLSYIKIAKLEEVHDQPDRTFTFSHRRFQEYFATSTVMRYPDKVSIDELITNGRWRETAVVIMQTKDESQLKEMLNTIYVKLREVVSTLGESFQTEVLPDNYTNLNLPSYSFGNFYKLRKEDIQVSQKRVREYLLTAEDDYSQQMVFKYSRPETWPQNLYHILSILQDGLSRKLSILPIELHRLIDKILYYFTNNGDIIDRKTCLEISGVASSDLLFALVKRAFESKSGPARDVAFRQLAKIGDIPEEMQRLIIVFIRSLSAEGKLFQNRQDMTAQLSRFENSKYYLDYHRFMVWTPIVDQILILIGLAIFYNLIHFNMFVFWLFVTCLYVWIKWHPPQLIKTAFFHGDDWAEFQFMITYFLVTFGTMFLASSEKGFIRNPQSWVAISCYGWGLVAAFISRPSKRGSIITNKVHWGFWPVYFALIVLIFLIGNTIYDNLPLMTAILIRVPGTIWLGLGLITLCIINILFMEDWFYIIPRGKVILREVKNYGNNKKLLFYIFRKNLSFVVFSFAIGMFLLMEVYSFSLLLDYLGVISVKYLMTIGGYIALIVCIIFFLATIVWIFHYSLRLVKEFRSFSKIKKLKGNNCSVVEIVELIQNYKIGFIRLLLIKHFSAFRKISSTEFDKLHLRNLIAFLDGLIRSENKPAQYELLNDADPEIAKYIRCPIPNNRFEKLLSELDMYSYKRGWDENLLDVLCELSEQLSNNLS